MSAIATRTFRGPKNKDVILEIHAPYAVDDGRTYFCDVVIRGLGKDHKARGGGTDGIQALVGALHIASAYLQATSAFKTGKLKWVFENGDLGLPTL